MEASLEKVIEWVMSEPARISAFRSDFSVVKKEFPSLSEDDLKILKSVQEKGLDSESLESSEFAEVEAQRSYGWADHPTK